MPVRISPEEFAEKHARNLKGSIEDIRRGVQRVDAAPTAKAAEKQDKMLANLQEAVNSGKWAARLRSVTLEEWKRKTLEKGVNRIAAGIDAAKDKQVDFARDLFEYENMVLAEIERMPDTTIEDSVARATHWIRRMNQFKRS